MPRTVFRLPPLVEIVAEVRWNLPGLPSMPAPLQQAGVPVPVTMEIGQAHELLFMNFASKVGPKGYGIFERVLPPGMPSLAYQVVYRYRNSAESQRSPLYQLGPGLFTTNISPPYKSWEAFCPVVESGLELLLEARPPNLRDQPFSGIKLRYIDAFSEKLTKGQPAFNFISDVLGFSVSLPESLAAHCIDKAEIKPTLIFAIPINMGRIDVTVSKGWINNSETLLMDTTVTYEQITQPSVSEVMTVLNKAHDVIYSSFFGLTKKLHDDMQPET